MSPLAGHAVVPAGWSGHHRAAAASTMTARCQVSRKDADPSNDNDGWSATGGVAAEAPDVDVWAGPCRVQALPTRVRQEDGAGEAVTTRTYLVAVPADAPAFRAGTEQGDTLVVTACPDDPQLMGRVLRVVDIQHGSLLWQRDLTCSDDLVANNPPSGPPAAPRASSSSSSGAP